MFEVKCEKDYGQFALSVTRNGYQWTTILLKDQTEMQKVISCLYAKMQPHDVVEFYKDE